MLPSDRKLSLPVLQMGCLDESERRSTGLQEGAAVKGVPAQGVEKEQPKSASWLVKIAVEVYGKAGSDYIYILYV